LREKLRGVADWGVMKDVNERAMAYYSAQGDLAGLPDKSLDLRARVLHAMGEDNETHGELDKALAKFTEARRTTAAILAHSPGNPEAIFTHAQSEYYVGLIAWRRGDRPTATRYWQGYLRQAQALAGVEPGSVRSLMEQGYAQGNLCELALTDHYDLKAAEKRCATSIRYEQEALTKAPGDRGIIQSLANRHGYMAELCFALKRYGEALASRRAEAALMDRLLQLDSGNFEYALRRSWSDIGAANIWIADKAPDRAVAVLGASLARHRKLFSANSTDERVAETRLRTHLFLACALRDLGRDHARELAEADKQRAAMAAFGKQFAAKAEQIRTSIWS
jgi:hypothetical protein